MPSRRSSSLRRQRPNQRNAHLITYTVVEEERYFITSLLQARGPQDLIATDALRQLDSHYAGLCSRMRRDRCGRCSPRRRG